MKPSVRDLFPALIQRNISEHKKTKEMAGATGSEGHDPFHDISVSQMTLALGWETNPNEARLASAAALCHSIDWILKRRLQIQTSAEAVNVPNVPEDEVKKTIREWLESSTDIRGDDLELVVKTANHHGSKPNSPDDPLVFVLLTDADRLENMSATVIARCGQHHARSLVLDPVHFEKEPSATYSNHKTVLWDVWNCTTWMAEEGPYVIRLPQARKIGERRTENLRQWIQNCKEDIAELGLEPKEWAQIWSQLV